MMFEVVGDECSHRDFGDHDDDDVVVRGRRKRSRRRRRRVVACKPESYNLWWGSRKAKKSAAWSTCKEISRSSPNPPMSVTSTALVRLEGTGVVGHPVVPGSKGG